MGLRFQDGTSPFVFRETARRDASTDDPAVIVIQFRLAFLGSSPALHAAFRRECVLHTPLFAGFPGFRSKLWADDVQTGVYAGVYEWQGAELARHYAERMVGLLAPFSNAGTARYHVIEHGRRDDFLMHPRQAPANGAVLGGSLPMRSPVFLARSSVLTTSPGDFAKLVERRSKGPMAAPPSEGGAAPRNIPLLVQAELILHRRDLVSTFGHAMEGAEHSSRELTVSVKVPCQECGGLGYVQTVRAGHVVRDKTKKCRTCRGRGLIPDDMPISELRELLK